MNYELTSPKDRTVKLLKWIGNVGRSVLHSTRLDFDMRLIDLFERGEGSHLVKALTEMGK